jgi:hypothetical protein
VPDEFVSWSYSSQKVNSVELEWLLRPWVDEAVCCGEDYPRRDQCTRANGAEAVSSDIYLANSGPLRVVVRNSLPVIISDYSRQEVCARLG